MTAPCLHHFILAVTDREVAADYFVELLELEGHYPNGVFSSFQLADEIVVNLVSVPSHAEIHPQHFAFLVDDDHFDRVLERIEREGIEYWADPARTRPSEVGDVNADGTGRRIYFLGPDGHYLELITARFDDVPIGFGQSAGPAE